MHFVKHEPSGHVEGQTILVCLVNDKWDATSNAKKKKLFFYFIFLHFFYICYIISVLRVASGPRVKLASCKSALNPPVVCFIDSFKAVVPVLVFLFVALWFILRGD